ncbi:MAG: hypothetical protein A2Z97_11010 [Bdellovibrionales bacterium GWB1_52_6]|nr:MAG: hypothetical protein A2Z97_11010 [Bdellovibrionales bacterium GWB1_52_6]OFZ03512.1 MAG: hypothetical protein A2X97_06080 [Bdellovibrionales bacterium GWA1_52_35]HCM41098.1 hypothetical protein [Bdellovibrionales bacterium]
MTASAGVSTEKKPIRCIVIQLARLGDTLQSLMALKAAKELYPELEICFVAREGFAAAAQRVSWLDKVITLPSDALLDPVLSGDSSRHQAMKELARWSANIISRPWDIAVNWSYSEASSYLTALIAAKVKLGYSRRKDLSLSAMDGWSHYLQSIVQGGIPQNIHLTDILTTQLLTALQIHYGEPSASGNVPATSKSFFSAEIDDFCTILHSDWTKRDLSRRWIAIQLGAARADKAWNPSKWAKVASLISARHPEYRFVLIGGKDEQTRGRAFLKEWESLQQDPSVVLNLVGQTGFDLWAAVIASCHWVFSCDTAALHLASALGTRVLNVSVGPVRYLETGPYGNAHFVIRASANCKGCESNGEKHSCHEDVTPEGVYAAWTYAATEWSHHRNLSIEKHFQQLGWSDRLDQISVFRSRIRDVNEGGGVNFEPLCRRPLTAALWSGKVIEQVARSWYCGWTPEIGKDLSREDIGPDLVKVLRELAESAEVLARVCEEANRLAIVMTEKSRNLKSERLMSLQDRTDLHVLSTNLQELDNLIHRLGANHKPLQGFSQMARVLMHNLAGKKLWEIADESAISYRQLADGASLYLSWVNHSLALAKPKALNLELIQRPGVERPFSAE